MPRAVRRQRGLALITFALTLVLLVPVVGLAIDTAMLYIVKERLNSAVQLAARSAQRASVPEEAVARYFNANFPDGYLGVHNREIEYREGRVRASVEAPAYFMRAFHIPAARVVAESHVAPKPSKP